MNKLVLHIEIDGFNAEGLDEGAQLLSLDCGVLLPEARLEIALGEWGLFREVGITLVKQADDGEDGPSVHPYEGRIIGVEQGVES